MKRTPRTTRTNRTKRAVAALALAAATAVGLSACMPPGYYGASGTLDNGDQKSMHVVVFNGWDEDTAASYLWKYVLEQKGYDVQLTNSDVAPAYSGLASGDYDVVFDTWLPNTHKQYMDTYGEQLTDLGSWNDQASLELAVPEYSDIDSIDELKAHASEFGNKIIGIEPAAGETKVVSDDVIPQYGLDGMDFITSSTPAMLADLKASIAKKEDVVVTLWRPHWAYDAFPIKDLKDPKGALGKNEEIHTIAKKSIEDDFPTASKWMKHFSMDSDTLYSLENALVNSGAKTSEYPAITKKWASEHKDFVDSLTSSK
ncbi:glycine betaine/proline transport system substrate-binding protein [Curtobacterium pusillum]|uniref:Glycine betaine/proline transport system substrate-binding protein n=1 Tax=Curtobacterium pusillum TaxID=69373 RepID=A0AAW3TAL6_9MICO|nr:glycine betaine ABC transporter substrate-binding protein [Curtobacterium pusillum]MBA8991628.1 glycine betaine/proline transport system substrate-binding protein [Curtobacterium pusillum]